MHCRNTKRYCNSHFDREKINDYEYCSDVYLYLFSLDIDYKMILLAELPVDHPLRNTPLIEIKAQYQIKDSKIWAEVTPPYGIAKKTYNQLGAVWTTWDKWRVGE